MSWREKGVTAPFLATLGRSSLERSSRERYVLRRQKLAHSLARPCSLSSALVFGFLDLDPPVPIAESDLAACWVWLSDGGPADPPGRRPRRGDESPGACLVDRRRSRVVDFRLGDRSWVGDPEDLRRVPGASAECDERRLAPPRRGEGEVLSSSTSNMSLLEPSSLSLKIPSKLGRSPAVSTLCLRVLALLLLPRRWLSPLLRRRALFGASVSCSTTKESFVGSKGTDVSLLDRRPSSRPAASSVPIPSSGLASTQGRQNWEQDTRMELPGDKHRVDAYPTVSSICRQDPRPLSQFQRHASDAPFQHCSYLRLPLACPYIGCSRLRFATRACRHKRRWDRIKRASSGGVFQRYFSKDLCPGVLDPSSTLLSSRRGWSGMVLIDHERCPKGTAAVKMIRSRTCA